MSSKYTLEYFQTTPTAEMLDDAIGLLRFMANADDAYCLNSADGTRCLAHNVPLPCPHNEVHTFIEQHDYFVANY